jgi:hypothetical protein
MRSGPWAAVAVAVLTAPPAARAANELRPRTPAVFTGTPCMVVVDKSAAPVLHIEYAVPFDDTMLTADELPTSRTHQFFAFAQQRFDFRPPNWINMTDVQAAIDNGDVMPAEVVSDDVLETSSSWPASTWARITPDDMRLPITFEQAAMGVDWDTTGVAAGTWMIGVYTWEPKSNLWSWRFGAVRVIDGAASADAAGPAAFLELETGATATTCEAKVVRGCIDAAAGSTYTASYGVIAGVQEPEWIPFAEEVAVEDGELAIELVLPSDVTGAVKVRLDVEDPEDRVYTAFSPAPIGVLASDAECGADDGDGGGGCSCASDRSFAALGLLPVLALARRRRRYQSTFSPHCSMREPS